VVGNGSGTTVTGTTTSLTVNRLPPAITVGPTVTPNPVSELGTASFSVSASTASGTLSYQWYQGGTVLGGATNANYTSTIGMTQGGVYTVVVGNGSGMTVTSTTASLTVNRLPPAITAGPTVTPNPVSELGSVTFGVTATTASGSLSYQWYQGGTLLGGATNANYTITNIGTTQGGIYR